ncbi:facilitated trehalose transporter Tret1-like [Prorops nasuta]|uniref:facilitated trehalose transporter Tret1-like n=1 Tax=Prorops nasuta TaxID=863751 RepID=UPI0034CF0720
MEKKKAITDPDESGKMRQLLATLIVNLSALSYGTIAGWTSPVTPQLQSNGSPVGKTAMSDEAASWLTGALCLGGILGTLLYNNITERFGRKLTGYLMSLPLGISWTIIIFATEHSHLYIARFLAGIGGAGSLFLVPLYVSEISSIGIRGMLGSLLVFILNLGLLLSYVLGPILSFRVFATCALLLPLLFFGTFLFLPESPVYLVRQNRLLEATRSLLWLRGDDKSIVDSEIASLQIQAKELRASSKSIGISDLFRDRGTIKGLIIALGLFMGQQLCGIFAMMSYTESIFKTSGSSFSPSTAVIIVGAIQLIGSYISTSLIERMGRRPLILISCSGMCLCHYILGTFCFFQDIQIDVSSFRWVPVVALSTYVIVYSLGMGPGPFIVTSEIFPRDISSLTTTIGLLSVWITAFLITKFFPNLIALLGMYGCFYLLGSFCALTFIFSFLLLPETKGRTLDSILNELNGAPHFLSDEKDHMAAPCTSSRDSTLNPQEV